MQRSACLCLSSVGISWTAKESLYSKLEQARKRPEKTATSAAALDCHPGYRTIPGNGRDSMDPTVASLKSMADTKKEVAGMKM